MVARIMVSILAVLAFASVSFAQPTDTYVSGLLHQPLGGAQFDPAAGRRLPVHNLGSSGEDGVEITMNSAYGGAVAVDVEAMLNSNGTGIRIRHKGWDGLIYGNQRLVSNGDGTGTFIFDFTDLGATALRVVQYDAHGGVISDETTPGGGPLSVPWVPNFTCPGGGYPIAASGWRRVCPTCPWFWWVGWVCSDGGTFTNQNARIVVTPTLPGGTPDPAGLESLLVTAEGLGDLVVSDASIAPFGVQSWGLDPARISEQCDDPAGCTPEQRKLHVDNLGSSGQDGVAIDLGPGTGGVSAGLARPRCCRGHVIIMKLYDDAGQEQRVSRTQTTASDGSEELDADFSALGATGFRLTLLDASGVEVGPPGGTDFFNGGPRPVFTNRCPVGQTEWWINTGTTSNPVWVFQGCLGGYDFVLPGYGPVPNVDSFRVEPLDATLSVGRLARCTITSDDPEGLILNSLVATPQTYVSGLLHQPLGGAELGLAAGRRLPVHNLGSSGEDGVEITMNSAYGGAVAVDVEAMLNSNGTGIRIRHKGWDGLIYGNQRLVSNGDGTGTFIFDFTDLGATALRVVQYDAHGGVISDETTPGGGPLSVPWVPNFTCPGGGYPIAASGWRRVCPTCPWFWWVGWVCSDGGTFTNQNARIVVTPTLPGGTPDPAGLESLLVTAEGLGDLVVSDASIAPFGVQSWGLDPARISEQCDDPAGCTPEQRKLHVDNLGSSGQDGVAIDLGPGTGGVSAGLARPRCCRGHVIIMKLYDDAGQEQRVSRTQTTASDGSEELDADFSALGATGFRLTLLDASGVEVGPPGGTAFVGGGPRPVFTNRCPVGQTEWWINTGTPNNPVWVFQGCVGGYDFVLPGYGPVPNVDSFRVEPLDATLSVGRLARCTITSDDPEGLIITGLAATPVAKGDLNWDGAVDLLDFGQFADCMAGPNVTTPPPGCDAGRFSRADLENDNDVDTADFAAFQAAFMGG